jgi:molybdopterin/thiamine biosynthesis adenylyltransferase
MRTIIRIPGNIRNQIFEDIEKNAPKETMLFMMAKRIRSSCDNIYIGTNLRKFRDDEIMKSAYSVEPKRKIMEKFYLSVIKDRLFEQDYRIVEIHSHPFCRDVVHFSSIDWSNISEDREAYKKAFPGMEFSAVVFNKNMSSYDSRIVYPDRMLNTDEIIFTGRNFQKLLLNNKASGENNGMYSRMLLIPGFDLEQMQNLKIGLVGLGGIGSCVLQSLVMLGIGENTETVICDHDRIELSNLSRIPYATKDNIGEFKTSVAEAFVKKMRPDRKIRAFPLPVYDVEVQKHLASCDIIIGASDSELAREFLNHIATSFVIPVIDTGSGIIADTIAGEETVMSGCQIRIYIPGVNPCFFCNMGIDVTEVNSDIAALFLDEKEKQTLDRSGYLQNLTDKKMPEPSVYNLNQHAATLATDLLISYVHKGYEYDTIHFDLEEQKITKMKAKSHKVCNHCGNREFLGNAEFLSIADFRAEKKDIPGPSFKKKAREKNVPKKTTGAKEDANE